MQVTLRFRAYPSDEVASEAWRHIDIHRQIRNHAVRDYYSYPEGNRPSAYQQHSKLTDWKQRWPLFTEVSAHAAQQTVSQIHKDQTVLESHEDNGLNPGRLRWQGVGEFRSVSYNQSSRYDVDHNTGEDGWVQVHLEKIGTFPVRAHRELPSANDIDRVVLKKERTGEWFACFVVEADEPAKPDPEDSTTPTASVWILGYSRISTRATISRSGCSTSPTNTSGMPANSGHSTGKSTDRTTGRNNAARLPGRNGRSSGKSSTFSTSFRRGL